MLYSMLAKWQGRMMKREKGVSLIETAVALGILAAIGVSFLNGLATTSTARATADEQVCAKALAESIIEDIKKGPYLPSYTPTIPDEYPGYTANVTVENPINDNIQQLTVIIHHHNHDALILETYKMKRTSS
jgi:type II secretory pathway pseudopilin PulG